MSNITKCGKCDTCNPGKCLNKLNNKDKIRQHKTSLPCGKCMNCKNKDKVCINPKYNDLKYTSEIFEDKELELMAKKGVYPYDYMDSFKKFKEQLPSKEEFYSILNDKHIEDETINMLKMCGRLTIFFLNG